MAILVVLSFEDDQAAADWVRETGEIDGRFSLENGMEGTFEVYAAYRQPTMFHGTFETHGAKKTGSAWTMGQKWGWWVCSVCKKPSQLYWETIKGQSSFGKNILDRLDQLFPQREKVET